MKITSQTLNNLQTCEELSILDIFHLVQKNQVLLMMMINEDNNVGVTTGNHHHHDPVLDSFVVMS